jgi:hypothetical protein
MTKNVMLLSLLSTNYVILQSIVGIIMCLLYYLLCSHVAGDKQVFANKILHFGKVKSEEQVHRTGRRRKITRKPRS